MLALIGYVLWLFLIVLFAYSILSWVTFSGTPRLRLAGPARSSRSWPGSASRCCVRCAGSSRRSGSVASAWTCRS